jgi:hypothetical protein
MRKLRLALLLAAAGLLSAVAAPGAPAAGPGKPTVVLQFVDVTTAFASTFDNRPPHLGDQLSFHDDIYRWHGTKRGTLAGHANITAVVIGPNLARLSAVAYLPGGTLVVYGDNFFNTNTQKFAVIGGTGIYATARGELFVRNLGGDNSNTSAITARLWM